MHDQCHRLNELILTFLANFVNGQSVVSKREKFCALYASLTNAKAVKRKSSRL